MYIYGLACTVCLIGTLMDHRVVLYYQATYSCFHCFLESSLLKVIFFPIPPNLVLCDNMELFHF